MRISIFILLALIPLALKAQQEYLFDPLGPDETGIDHVFGKKEHAGLEGGGVGIGDLNNDGLADIFLVGDSLHGLYKNKGELQFESKFSESGIEPYRGGTSVLIYDINLDGKNDLILGRRSHSNHPLYQLTHPGNDFEQTGSNLMIYLNCGDFKFCRNENFEIVTRQTVSGLSVADFDKNGLPDLVISSWEVDFSKVNSALLNAENISKAQISPVQLFMQIEKGVFKEKSLELGLKGGSEIKTSFAVSATDLNHDTYPDLVIAQDFDLPDLVFINQKGAYFEQKNVFKSTSFFSMGMDAADFNNNGNIDLMIADMRPATDYRQKTVRYEKLFEWDALTQNQFIARQEVRNTLQINQGNLQFSEISQRMDVDATDWSWSVLLADFDNNSRKDIFISNGYYYQKLFHMDAPYYMDSLRKTLPSLSHEEFLIYLQRSDTITATYFKNYFFSNENNLEVKDKSKSWDPSKAMNTRGAAYGDLDRDGDLELVLNNVKSPASILKNLSREQSNNAYLQVKLSAADHSCILHSKVLVYTGNEVQMQELQPSRGFYSSSETTLHFGLDAVEKIDSLKVIWPDANVTLKYNVPLNQLLNIEKASANGMLKASEEKPFCKAVKLEGLEFLHLEDAFNDLVHNPLLDKMYSKSGPPIQIADFDQNKLDDVLIGGAAGQASALFLQHFPGKFENISNPDFIADAAFEDMAIEILDLNGDQLPDLYVGSGISRADSAALMQDRLYLNQGNGKFSRSKLLPKMHSATSTVKSTKLKDGSTLLFVGSTFDLLNFKEAPPSYLFQLKNGKLKEVTAVLFPKDFSAGFVRDALFTDFNNDGNNDLIILSAYRAPVFLKYENGKFEKTSQAGYSEDSLKGFWNCIATADLNDDKFPDFILGNAGENLRYKARVYQPLTLMINDFDDNDFDDLIFSYYENDQQVPIKSLQTFKMRLNGFSKRFLRYADFAKLETNDLFSPEKIKAASHYEITTTASVALISNGEGGYEVKKLPDWAQAAPINTILPLDIDADGQKEYFVAGNFSYNSPEYGLQNASNGIILKQDKNGNFQNLLSSETGFYAPGENRSIALLKNPDTNYVLLGVNNDSLKIFELKTKK